MSNVPLSPCPACQRHLRADASRCPFCAAAVDASALREAPDTNGSRLSRAAIFAFATSVAACSTTRAPTPAQSEPANVAPAPAPAPAPVAAPEPGPEDNGAVAAIYGAPAAQMTPDAGSPAPADAGAPAVHDAGAARADAGRPPRPVRPPRPIGPGGPMVRYGAPPAPEDDFA